MANRRFRIAILSFSQLARDGRVLREVRALTPDYEVHLVGYGEVPPAALHGARLHMVPNAESFWSRNAKAIPKLVLGRVLPSVGYERWYWDRADHRAALAAIEAIKPDLILANDWDALPAAARASERTGARVVLDLHEYSPRQFDNRKVWMALIAPMIEDALRRHGPRVSRFATVNSTLAERYLREFGFSSVVIMNVPEIGAAPPFHATSSEHIRMVHHGAPTRDRKLECMIEIVAACDARYSLTFRLIDSDSAYVQDLRTLAERVVPGRVRFEPAVPPAEIVQTIGRYDIGIFVLPPTTSNYAAALPNKFFEFISAGLAVCIGPSPEMARIARQYECGVVGDSFDPKKIAVRLNALTAPAIDAMKRAAIVARGELTSANEMNKLRAVVAECVGKQ